MCLGDGLRERQFLEPFSINVWAARTRKCFAEGCLQAMRYDDGWQTLGSALVTEFGREMRTIHEEIYIVDVLSECKFCSSF